ncbi:VMAP-C domain-containing protein [Leptothoe kymatousa]|uniref:Trypsin-like peptidase domain-containing protein n=1 Tax=Leptothoe kymatousa TAU-MAC 1615 TaxID=2364775 RepID=A0ABS5Y794_9CYAN|nr:trypsin-like peptidase domain-containing protein [Leptothoe kymatousa]MBT9313685.1 trypsin-like peptidase domain-containing protein [Leptothoe kymatousa TAU-MAC 1615]
MPAIEFEVGKRAIVQVYRGNADEIAGTGFWIGGRYLMTCAHVVGETASLGQQVGVMFDQAGQTECLTAELVYHSFNAAEGYEDIAVLRLSAPIDVNPPLVPIQFPSSFQDYLGATVRTFGYLAGNPAGRNLSAQTAGSTRNWLQLEVPQGLGTAIREGVSGSPVWHEDTQLFVGLVVARDALYPDDRLGFMISVDQLRTPLKLVQRKRLWDVLELHAETLRSQIAAAYRLCRGENARGALHNDPEKMLEELSSQGAGGDDGVDKLVQFTASLVDNLVPQQFGSLITTLTAWANEFTDDFDAVRTQMRTAALERQNQEVVPASPVLLVSIHDREQNADLDAHLVDAWLIPDPAKYDPKVEAGETVQRLSLEKSLVESLQTEQPDIYQVLPKIIEAYLNQIAAKDIDTSDLTLEVLLPFALMNKPLERLGIPFLAFHEPLGIADDDCPQVLLRSQARVDQPRALLPWQKKWKEVKAHQATVAQTKFIEKDKKLKRSLKSEAVLGLKLSSSPDLSDAGDIALLVITGTPLALWVRDNDHAGCDWCKTLDTDLLSHQLCKVPEEVLNLRRETEELDDDTEYCKSAKLGHHLAVLWENPNHIPPSTDNLYSQAHANL